MLSACADFRIVTVMPMVADGPAAQEAVRVMLWCCDKGR